MDECILMKQSICLDGWLMVWSKAFFFGWTLCSSLFPTETALVLLSDSTVPHKNTGWIVEKLLSPGLGWSGLNQFQPRLEGSTNQIWKESLVKKRGENTFHLISRHSNFNRPGKRSWEAMNTSTVKNGDPCFACQLFQSPNKRVLFGGYTRGSQGLRPKDSSVDSVFLSKMHRGFSRRQSFSW